MVRSLGFLGVRTNAFAETAALYRDVLGLSEPQRDGGIAWNHYRGPDGNLYEIIGADRGAA
jgi:hypothetical protein